ncbi:MAG: hypothetical protein ACOC0R_05160 [Mariniphaga sp.]
MRIKFLIFFMVYTVTSWSQSRNSSDWFDYGSSHVSKWIQVAPGKLGPNALPVPEMDYADVGSRSWITTGAHLNVMKGDTAVNSYLDFHWTIAPGKIAVKIWGYPTETYRQSNEIRNERQIYYDDPGWSTTGGDLWISTFIQLLRHHRLIPDLAINYSMKTTTGSILHARYTDAPAHYFYLAAGKSYFPGNTFIDEVRLAAMGGIYIWQTNKVEMAQDEGPLLEAGLKIRHSNFMLYNEVGGYDGYGAYGYMGVDDYNFPIVFRTGLIHKANPFGWKLEFKTGWKDYNYASAKLELVYNIGL